MLRTKEGGYILEGKREQETAYRLLQRKGYETAQWQYIRTNGNGWHVFKNKSNSTKRIEI